MRKMRKIGENILVKLWNFICDVVEVLLTAYSIALSDTATKYKLNVRATFSAIATAISCGVCYRLMQGSMIKTGINYAFLSLSKRSIINEGYATNWKPYIVDAFNDVTAKKANLIATDGFAGFLNKLASNGFGKILQVLLIVLCFAATALMIYIIGKSAFNFGWSIKEMIARAVKKAKKPNKKRPETAKAPVAASNIYDFENYLRNNNNRNIL